MSQIRTMLFVGIAATFGTANAGVIEVGSVTHSSDAAANKITFTVANTGAGQVSDLQMFVNGHAGAATCASTTSTGNAFALTGELGAGDNVQCSGFATGTTTSITVHGNGSNGIPFDYTAHSVQLAAAVPNQAQIGILQGAIFNDEITATQTFEVGETISLSFTIFNLGNVALSGIVVSDDQGTVITCPQNSLAVGATMICSGTHTIVTADVNSGQFASNGNVDAFDPGSQPVNSGDSIQRFGSSQGEIRGLKSPLFAADNDGNNVAGPGDLVEYTFAVTNSGKLTLSNITLSEPDPTRIDSAITCDTTTVAGAAFGGLGTGTLNPGDSVLCFATYTITPADVTNGAANNLALISGLQPVSGSAGGSAASALVVPAAPPVGPVEPTPVNDWRALLLLGLGLLVVAVSTTRRKTQKR